MFDHIGSRHRGLGDWAPCLRGDFPTSRCSLHEVGAPTVVARPLRLRNQINQCCVNPEETSIILQRAISVRTLLHTYHNLGWSVVCMIIEIDFA